MHRVRLVAVAVSLLALVALVGCNKLKARDELNKGVRAYKAAQFETAIEHFKRAIEADPELLNARVYLAIAYAGQYVPGAPSEENKQLAQSAIQEFENVLEMDPGNVTALSHMSTLYFEMSKAEEGEEEIRRLGEKSKEYRHRLIELEPQNPLHYYYVGTIDWGLAHRANAQVRTDLGLRPDEPLPRRVVGDLREKNDELVEEGIQMLKKAIELNPKYVDAITYLNLMYRQKADIVDSPQERERYLELADQMFERQKQLRERMEEAEAEAAATAATQ